MATVIFLVDTGADKSVFSADVLRILNLPFLSPDIEISGVGNDLVDSVAVETIIRFQNKADKFVNFNGKFNAVVSLEALDFCVLGRDILRNFAVIIDEPNQTLVLLAQNHFYEIKSK